jgi:replication-associated recombination protein RarA
MLPSSYKPRQVDDFIGSARRIAAKLDTLLAAATRDGKPLAILMLGRPGIGKSALANYLTQRLGCDRWHTTLLNGTQVKIEEVEEIARSLHFKELFGVYRLIRVEEVDKVPHVAQVRLLTLLDEMPERTAFVCTSNCQIKELEERFQSRFLVLQVAPPTDQEIASLLRRLAPQVPDATVRQIATFACGNVRQALLDTDAAMLNHPELLAA